MSEAGDDPNLEEYLRRGTEVSRRYRELDADSVPPELDRRVLDSARAAVSKPRTWVRWGAPIAVAASAVLVLSIVIETGVDEHAVLQAPGPEPQPSAAYEEKPEAAMSHPSEQSREREEKRAAGMARRDSSVAQDAYEEHRGPPLIAGEADSPVMVVPVQPPAPEAALEEPTSSVSGAAAPAAPPSAPPAPEVQADTANEPTSARNEASKTLQRQSEMRARPQAEPALRSAAPESADAAKLQESSAIALPNPELWLESIRELRREGKSADADREWQRFREVFPNYPVAEGDSARKAGTR